MFLIQTDTRALSLVPMSMATPESTLVSAPFGSLQWASQLRFLASRLTSLQFFL